jgi:hypothetical protein
MVRSRRYRSLPQIHLMGKITEDVGQIGQAGLPEDMRTAGLLDCIVFQPCLRYLYDSQLSWAF